MEYMLKSKMVLDKNAQDCSEHIFSMCTICINRKSQKKSSYLAFLDAENAFDHVD